MGKREKKIAVIKSYLPKCTSWTCYTYGNIPRNLFNNACNTYAGNVSYENAFGLIDETVFGSGKAGFLFTDVGFYEDSGSGLQKYADGISYNSLPSTYNLNLMNEMLSELYDIEQSPSGIEFGLGLLGGIFSAITEVAEQVSIPDAISYLKKVALQVQEALECEPDEIKLEAGDVIALIEESDGSQEEAMNSIFERHSELPPIDMVIASQKCLQRLRNHLPAASMDMAEFQACQSALRRYQKKLNTAYSNLQQIQSTE